MILPDVNVLLYAFRKDSKDHARYRAWLHSVVNGPAAYGISPQVLSSVVRISTHPGIFVEPSDLADALDFCRTLAGQPNATLVVPADRHWSIFEQMLLAVDASGNRVQDAWLAALAIEWGCEWISTDRDFARFPGLVWRRPF